MTPAQLTSASTGVSWSTLPGPRSNDQAQIAQQIDICWEATSMVDLWCNQMLRATVNNEILVGPHDRLTVGPRGSAIMTPAQWPVISVLGAQVSSTTSFPPQWTVIPVANIGPREQLGTLYAATPGASAGSGPTEIELGGGYVNWGNGRQGTRLEVIYINGWPHTGLIVGAHKGDTTLQVDDVTGWTGYVGQIYDGAVDEVVTVASTAATVPVALPTGGVVQAGPGTLNLAGPLVDDHAAGVAVSALPGAAQWATILFSCSIALSRGATATTVQAQPGRSSPAGGASSASFKTAARAELTALRRVI